MLDYKLLNEVKSGFQKKAFQGADAMAPQGGGAPMDPAMMDPSMMDPSMMDPSMMAGGGAPVPPGLDPAMAGMVGGAGAMPPPGDGTQTATITCTLDELIKFIQKLMAIKNGDGMNAAAAPAPAQPANNDLTEIKQALTLIAAQLGNGGGGAIA